MFLRRILIVEDEADLSLLLQTFFERKMFEVVVAHSLAEGARILLDWNPEIILIDNNLPDGDGWPAAAEWQTQYPGIVVVRISAFRPASFQLPPAAAALTLEKPVSFADLERLLPALSLPASR